MKNRVNNIKGKEMRDKQNENTMCLIRRPEKWNAQKLCSG